LTRGAATVTVPRGGQHFPPGDQIAALRTWDSGSDSWNRDVGELSPALVAHVMDVRLHSWLDGSTAVVDQGGPMISRRVVMRYRENHYSATVTAPDDQHMVRNPDPGQTHPGAGGDDHSERKIAVAPPIIEGRLLDRSHCQSMLLTPHDFEGRGNSPAVSR